MANIDVMDTTAEVTKADYDKLTPRTKGYVCYMVAARPGSKIPDVNPYMAGTRQHDEFRTGEQQAMRDAEDMGA